MAGVHRGMATAPILQSELRQVLSILHQQPASWQLLHVRAAGKTCFPAFINSLALSQNAEQNVMRAVCFVQARRRNPEVLIDVG